MIRWIGSTIGSAMLRHAWRWSWWLSVVVHSMIACALLSYWFNRADAPTAQVSETIHIQGGFTQRSASEIQEVLLEQPSDRQERSRLLQDIRQQMKLAQERGEKDNFERLKQLSAELRRSSTSKTVDEMTEFFNGTFGSRATEPDAKKADLPFDVSTAQMHDISKTTDDQGVVRYVLVMIDAQGVAREVEIDSENGQRLYKTMQLIKSNPLLEKVYRNILMGILDRVLKDDAANGN